jgi:DNA polymerase/3'-5' exonuclease PolX
MTWNARDERKEYELSLAKTLAKDLIDALGFLEEKFIVGSIRRGKEKVHDIDIVAIPRFHIENKIISGIFQGMKFEIYIANKDNYEILKLIRTGSAEHNKMLCQKAKEKGWQLKFDSGLIDKDGNIIDNTERGILEKLLGNYVEPQDREIKSPIVGLQKFGGKA